VKAPRKAGCSKSSRGGAHRPATVDTIATRYLHFIDVYLAAAATMEA
jgi:hypothetical protein